MGQNEAPRHEKSAKSISRLVGWLVSYASEARGAFFEIRAGRSIISSEKASSERCIMVQEDSISAPHCAMSASTRHTVVLQDIFSENGTWIVKSGSKDEKPINGPVEIEHGDWIRIGDNTRFQVCLIDGPGR